MIQFKLTLMAAALLCAVSTQSQTIHGSAGAEAAMQGQSATTLNNSFSVINSPSRISFLKNWQSGMYHEQRLSTPELNLSALSVAWPNRIVDVGVGISRFGFNAFNQQRFVLSAAKKLSQTMSLGVQANYVATSISEYGQTGSWVAGAGLSYQPSGRIGIACMLYNPTQQKLSERVNEPIPSYIQVGLQYQVSKVVYGVAEADHQLLRPLRLKTGLRYNPHERVGIAVGVASNPFVYTFGSSVRVAHVAINMAAGVHQVLGITQQVSLRFPAIIQ